MTDSGPVTGLISNTERSPGVELMTGRRSVFINGTTNLTPNLSDQGDATGARIVSAFHAHQLGRQAYRHFRRHAVTCLALRQLGRMKVHPVTGTTGTAAFTDRQA